MINRSLIDKALRFAIVGSLGFLTDAGLLWVATNKFGLDPYSARLVSFSTALLTTWLLNSQFTFKSPKRRTKSQFTGYVVVQVTSFFLNYALYSLFVWQDVATPLVSLFFAAIISMFYSFTAVNIWVFGDRRQ
ncbi:GtrA family protein [Thalassospira sp.]|uniref:GtrA family protein n=1 Tax=Thalassospira sp. TaxID=1912094 RepID=UPI001B20D2BB|nr:GtrA family protein [Thalassospira sp.]MBO6807770.1 GtrA family protein [Thalassospira sp.]MBO6841020.1 GtrA family protein [Thalassospira sp.]